MLVSQRLDGAHQCCFLDAGGDRRVLGAELVQGVEPERGLQRVERAAEVLNDETGALQVAHQVERCVWVWSLGGYVAARSKSTVKPAPG